jgi:hypothetical protein
MRSAARLVIVALLGLFLALPAVSVASAATATDDDVVVTTTTAPSSPPSATSGAGTIGKLNPEQESDKAESKRKLIMGVASVVLLGLVIWGRSVRRKRRAGADGG